MEEKKIKAYKAFNKDMTCRGFQYEVGKKHEMDGDIQICERGFHACENPLDLWNYYDMTTSRFAEVVAQLRRSRGTSTPYFKNKEKRKEDTDDTRLKTAITMTAVWCFLIKGSIRQKKQ